MALNTHTSPTGKDSAVKGLTDTLNAAYQSLADAREGKDPDSSTAMTSGGSIGRAIYQIVSTRADAGRFAKQEAVTGYARTRDANGRLVAHQRVMVFKDELMHLYSQFDSLYTRFKNRSSKADRQNVADILNDLKEAVASQAAGQEFDENTDLRKIITFDFPLKTPALDTSAQEIAVMTTPAFNNWLESLTARPREDARSRRQNGMDHTGQRTGARILVSPVVRVAVIGGGRARSNHNQKRVSGLLPHVLRERNRFHGCRFTASNSGRCRTGTPPARPRAARRICLDR